MHQLQSLSRAAISTYEPWSPAEPQELLLLYLWEADQVAEPVFVESAGLNHQAE